MKRVAVAVGAVLAVVVVTALTVDWRFLRPTVEQMASERLGRQVTLTGFRMSLLPHLKMHFEGLRIPNAPGAQQADMVRVDEAEVQFALWPALHRQVVLDALAIRGGEVYLSRSKDGDANWALPGLPQPAAIRTVALDHVLVFYDDRQDDLVFNLRVDRNPVRTTAKVYPVLMEFDGSYRNSRYKGNALTGSVISLRESEALFPFKIDAAIGTTRLKAEGTVGDILAGAAIDVSVDVAGHALSGLSPFVDLPMEATAPYSIRGRIQREQTRYTLTDLSATLGKSDLSGNAVYEERTGRPSLKATLRSQLLDTKDLGPLIGLRNDPGEPPPDRKAQRGSETGKKVDQNRRVTPDLAFDTALLNRMDADIAFDATTVRVNAAVFDNVKTHVVLDDRILKIAPLAFGYAGGVLNASMSVDARNQSTRAEANIALRKARLSKLFPDAALLKRSSATLGADIKLKGQGNSIQALLAHADGSLGLAAAGADLPGLLAEAVGADAGRALGITTGEKKPALRCAVASFDVSQGMASAAALAIDTPETIVRGTGTVNFADERLNLRLEPDTKDKSAAAARASVNVLGSVANPDYKLDRTMAQKASATPASTARISALLPLIDLGYGRQANCATLLGASEPAIKETGAAVRSARGR